jgi:hypothetical protein
MKRRKTLGGIAVHGALAGALGAATMTVLRMLAHRRGWIQAMVPQAVEMWVQDKSPLPMPRRVESHHVADQLLHLGYGATAGALYALTRAPARSRAQPARALEFGTALWVLGSFVLFPALKIARPAWRAAPREELVNLAAHLLYGSVTEYLLDEFEHQRHTQPRTRPAMHRAAVG